MVSGCTEEVQLAHCGGGGEAGGPNTAAPPDVARDDYCKGRGSPVAAELLDPSGADTTGACVEPAPRVFRYALCSCEDAVLTGAFAADAFDSSLAAYAPGGTGASVGVNGQLVTTGDVDIQGLLTRGRHRADDDPLSVVPRRGHAAGQRRSDVSGRRCNVGRDLWVHGDILAAAAGADVAGDVYQPPGYGRRHDRGRR